jgi:hypothetical protein
MSLPPARRITSATIGGTVSATPDLIEPITAWRTWYAYENHGRLWLMSINGTTWPAAGKLAAECPNCKYLLQTVAVGNPPITAVNPPPQGMSYAQWAQAALSQAQGDWELPELHDPPGEACTCGIYAKKTLDEYLFASMSTHNMFWGQTRNGFEIVPLLGKVKLWGKVIEHETGYRAQYAEPLSLIILEEAAPIQYECRLHEAFPSINVTRESEDDLRTAFGLPYKYAGFPGVSPPPGVRSAQVGSVTVRNSPATGGTLLEVVNCTFLADKFQAGPYIFPILGVYIVGFLASLFVNLVLDLPLLSIAITGFSIMLYAVLNILIRRGERR